MSNKIKLYLVDYEEQDVNHIDELFLEHQELGVDVIGYAHTYGYFMNNLSVAKKADLFIISAYLPDNMGYELIKEIKKMSPNSKIIMKVDKNTANLDSYLREKGADEVLLKPFKIKKLLQKIDDVIGREDVYESAQVNEEETVLSTPIENAVVSEEDEAMEDNKELIEETPIKSRPNRKLFEMHGNPITEALKGKDEEEEVEKPNVVAAFTSPGGAGKTALTANIAHAIHKYGANNPKICIVDFDLLFPSISFKFHNEDIVECKRDIYDLAEDMNHLDEDVIRQSIKTHYPTGISILNTPFDPKSVHKTHLVTIETIEQLIIHLREMFDVILIDTSRNVLEDSTIYPIQVADVGVLLFEPDLANLMNTKKYMHMLEELEDTLSEEIISKLLFVLNKENEKSSVQMETIKTLLLGNKVDIRIPDDPQFTHLSNNGRFVTELNNSTSSAVQELARLIYPMGEGTNKTSKSLFGSIIKKIKK